MFKESTKIKRIVGYLEDDLLQNNFSGYDPMTITHTPRYRKILLKSDILPAKIWNSLMDYAKRFLSPISIRLINPPILQYTKAIALTASGFSFLYRKTDIIHEKKYYLKMRIQLLDLLSSKRLPDSGLWGHDACYSIKGTRVTPDTPNLVTTVFAMNAYWDWYEATSDQEYLDLFCKLVLKCIEVFPINEHLGRLCISYTPNSLYFVHNANLLFADCLARVNSVSPLVKHKSLIDSLVCYSLTDFQRTGSFPYAGPPTPNDSFDNYHCGYVLRSLLTIRKYYSKQVKEFNLDKIIEALLKFYDESFITGKYVYRDQKNLMNSHSLAETIIVLNLIQKMLSSQKKDSWLQSIGNTFDLLWVDSDKYFINEVKFLLGERLILKDKTKMIRWSQAWMFYALTYHLCFYENI
jgi:hypothetical protein